MRRACFFLSPLLLAAFAAGAAPIEAQETSAGLEERLRALERQNELLRDELANQKRTINDLQERLSGDSAQAPAEAPKGGMNFGKVHLSAEGGVGWFHTSSDGDYSNGSFRVDEAKLFLEAPIWENTYFFGELDLVIREANDEFFHLGELYIDFENVLRHWTDHTYLSVRAGRIDIPFGEEYLARDVIDNPLISHSLSDLWGIDEGIEFYGSALGFDYVVAVQNGGHPTLGDFDGDKSIAGRIGYNFGQRARLSISGMRTGELSVEEDEMSELWFGDGFFTSIGPSGRTSTFEANVYELDGQLFWTSGHLKAAGGYYTYKDNDHGTDNSRDGYYYYLDGLQRLTPKFYAASRFSHILADPGMPIVGFGDFGKYFFGPLTDDLWRWSLGLGYRWSENLVTKLEYAREEGELASGRDRQVNFIAAEIGFKF